jgi:hypothetical protein
MALSDEVLEMALRHSRPAASADRALLQVRVCGRSGCNARLSRYNDSSTCWLHGPGSDPMRGPR